MFTVQFHRASICVRRSQLLEVRSYSFRVRLSEEYVLEGHSNCLRRCAFFIMLFFSTSGGDVYYLRQFVSQDEELENRFRVRFSETFCASYPSVNFRRKFSVLGCVSQNSLCANNIGPSYSQLLEVVISFMVRLSENILCLLHRFV